MKKRLIKEASGGNNFNTPEIVARMILFKPYLARYATDEPNKCQCLLLFLEAKQLRVVKMRKNMMAVRMREIQTDKS